MFRPSWAAVRPAALGAAALLAARGPAHAEAPLWNDSVPKESASNLKPHHLMTWRDGEGGLLHERDVNKRVTPLFLQYPKFNFINPDERVMGHIIFNDSKASTRAKELTFGCVRANACEKIWWDPKQVKAGIVTCGGLCPGLNSIVREVTECLTHQYGVKEIVGFQSGYNGLNDPESYPPMNLTTDVTRNIHLQGGSVLKAGRGGFDAERCLDNLRRYGINMLFVVGGDGTQAAANLLYKAAQARGMPLSIIGVPKSIDNDVLFFDRTFGFDTAVASGSEIIRSAYTEATSCYKGVGIVKLMGRDAGFVAMNASMATDVVDLCLIPEAKVKIEDIMKHVDNVLERKGFMVMAVAEGAMQDFVESAGKDDTGHTKYGDIGVHLRDAVNTHLKPQGGRSFYIDPSYVIRSVPVRPVDHIYCGRLARDAVHTGMRGYTGVVVGPIHNIICIMPMGLIASGKRRVNLRSSAWQSCVQSCNMPDNVSGLGKGVESRREGSEGY